MDIPLWKIKEISMQLEDIKVNIPCEFARKSRKLNEVKIVGRQQSSGCFCCMLELL